MARRLFHKAFQNYGHPTYVPKPQGDGITRWTNMEVLNKRLLEEQILEARIEREIEEIIRKQEKRK